MALDPSTRVVDGGRVLIGGSPLRVVRLQEAGAAVVRALAAGATVSDAGGGVRRTGGTARLVRRLLDAGMVHPRVDVRSPHRWSAADVTVVIPVRDRAAELGRALASLPAGVPRVVVDDGSVDGSGEVAAQAWARVVRRDHPGGPAAARNAGLAAVDTPLVAFLDSDCVAPEAWLEELLPHFDDAAVALVAPRIGAVQADGSVLARYEAARSPLDLGPSEAAVRPQSPVAYVPAAALVGRVDVLRSVGGFAESLHVGEDVDLVWRLHEAGWTVRYDPSVVVAHDHRLALGALLRRRFAYGTSAALLDGRHPGKVPPVAMSPWSLGAWGLVATGTAAGAAGGVAVMAGTTVALGRKLRGAVPSPEREAVRMAGRGHLLAGLQLADAVTRAYLPVAVAAAAGSRRARRVLAVAVAVSSVTEWRRRRPGVDPFTWTVLRTLDDGAYCLGVWDGCRRAHRWGALRPQTSSS